MSKSKVGGLVMKAGDWRCPKCGDDNWFGCQAFDCPGKIRSKKSSVQTKWLLIVGAVLLGGIKVSELLDGKGREPSAQASGLTGAATPSEFQQSDAEQPQDVTEASSAESSTGDDEAAATPQPTTAPPPSASQLSGAVAAALESGKSVAWEAGDESGTVDVSSPTVTSDGECRTVRVKKEDAVWCRASDGQWKLSQS